MTGTKEYPTSQNIKRVGDEVGFISHSTICNQKKKKKKIFSYLIGISVKPK